MPATYLDSSAIVKLVVDEPESAALRQYLRRRRPLVSSALARTEVVRAVLPGGGPGLARARDVLSSIDLIRANARVLNEAGLLLPANLRSLDATHLATARQLGPDLSRLIAYDERCSTLRTTPGSRPTRLTDDRDTYPESLRSPTELT